MIGLAMCWNLSYYAFAQVLFAFAVLFKSNVYASKNWWLIRSDCIIRAKQFGREKKVHIHSFCRWALFFPYHNKVKHKINKS